MRIAIIGTGISGLGAAFKLNPAHDIVLYEKNGRIGGHTRTVSVEYEDKTIPVDTGFIVFNRRNYPLLSALFDGIGVATQKTEMSFGFSSDEGAFEWSGKDLNAVFGQRRHLLSPRFYKMLRDILRFNKEATKFLKSADPTMTLGEMLRAFGAGDYFINRYLIPMGAAIWSCSAPTMLSFPARTFIQFFHNHGLLTVNDQPQWETVTGGSKEYLTKLIAPFANKIRTGCGAVKVVRVGETVFVHDVKGETEAYDKVIFACHADETLDLLGGDAVGEEREALSAFTYQKNIAYLHCDPAHMPVRERVWSAWNYISLKDGAASVTYWMNLLQNIDPAHPLFVTLNPIFPVRDDMIFDRYEFYHPVFTAEAIAAQNKLTLLQGLKNTYYCGAYMRYGFHEDGLMSGYAAAEAVGRNQSFDL